MGMSAYPILWYTKLPVDVEAMYFDGTEEAAHAALSWMTLHGQGAGRVTVNGDVRVRIHTLEGWMEATKGDYIVRGAVGEFYPCKPEPFSLGFGPGRAVK